MVMETSGGDTMAMGVKCTDNMVSKSLDNIVGNLWQARQESSGSSMGNQSPRNGEDLSDGEQELETGIRESSPEGSVTGQVRVKDTRDLLKEKDPDIKDHELLMRDPRAFLANLPPLPTLEAFQRHRDMLSSPQSFLSAAAASLRNPGGLMPPTSLSQHMSPFGMSPLPQRPPSQPTTPSSQSSSPVQQSFGSNAQNWSFEEQFKQLYEIDDNPKRKEFLDELFSYMQKRGTPINRLPIMAKQVLDLYELFNLVIARGGLVEVINKKLWQEVIKGLGLPSSITSAAFTLRTQYTKYLYPLECRKKNLSNPTELQAAIEGNKREGRRGSYGSFPSSDMMPLPHHALGGIPGMPSQISPMSLVTSHQRQFNGSSHHGMPPTSPWLGSDVAQMLGLERMMTASSPGHNGVPQDPLSALEMTRLALWKMYNQAGAAAAAADMNRNGGMPNLPGMPGMPGDLLTMTHHAEQRQRMLDAVNASRCDESDSEDKCDEVDITDNKHSDDITSDKDTDDEHLSRHRVPPPPTPPEIRASRAEILEGEEDIEDLEEEDLEEPGSGLNGNGNGFSMSASPPPAKKRRRSDEVEDDPNLEMSAPRKINTGSLGIPGANIKISSRGDGRNGDSSLVVSMEINGINYQGVLFAQPLKHRSSS